MKKISLSFLASMGMTIMLIATAANAQEAMSGLLCNSMEQVVTIMTPADHVTAHAAVNAEKAECSVMSYFGMPGKTVHEFVGADGTTEVREIVVLGIFDGVVLYPLSAPTLQYGPFRMVKKTDTQI